MRRRRIGLAAAMAVCLAGPGWARETSDPVEAVDVFIGTAGKGHTFPGAVAPFGMTQLSPQVAFELAFMWR